MQGGKAAVVSGRSVHESVCGERCLLAHNLNNKLAVIIGQCEMLADDFTDLRCRARLGVIRQMAQAIANEVNDHHCQIMGLLTSSRIDGVNESEAAPSRLGKLEARGRW